MRCINGATGLEEWRSTTVPEYGMQVELLADVTGDDIPEVIVGSWENAVSVLHGADGTQVWKTTVGTLNGGDVTTVSGIADLDHDGVPDVIAGSYDEYVYAMSGVDGAVIWAYNTGHRVYSVAPIADVNGDGVDDVIVGNQNLSSSDQQVVHVLSGAGFAPVFRDGFETGNTSSWSDVLP